MTSAPEHLTEFVELARARVTKVAEGQVGAALEPRLQSVSDLVAAGEPGVAFEILVDNLVEYDIPLTADERSRLLALGATLGVDATRLDRLVDKPRLVRVRFQIVRDGSGWPPAESEGLWAQRVGASTFRLDNTPWFVNGVAAGDEVEAVSDAEGNWWFSGLVSRGDRMVVRVIPRRDGPLEGDRMRVVEIFHALGVSAEQMESPVSMVALDIGPEADHGRVKRLLSQGEADGRWYFDEGCVAEAWSRGEP